MNGTGRILLCCMLALTLGFAGCGSDEDEPGGTLPGTTTDKGGTTADEGATKTDEGGTMADEGGTMADEGGAKMDEGAAPMGACMNAADQALLDTEEKRDAVQAKAGDCGKNVCLTKPADEQAQCALDCIQADHALTDECTACYAGSVKCGIVNCVAQCVTDTGSEACLTCLGEHCLPTFYTCSGFTPPTE